MKADVVLLQLPFWGVGCPPLGPALLKSYLAENDISCKIFDINAHAYSVRGKRHSDWWDLKNGYYFFQQDKEKMLEFYLHNRALFLLYMSKIIELSPKIVGCTSHNTSAVLIDMFLEELRIYLPDAKFIVGGPEVAGFMNNADDVLKREYIDAVCLDEGEIPLHEYCKAVSIGKYEPINGLVYKNKGSIIRAEKSSPVLNLDSIPFPNFSDFDMNYYYKPNSLPTYSSRGCVNKCIYCSGRAYMKYFRMRSGKRIFEEMRYLKKEYPEVDYMRLSDNVSNGNIKELESLCDNLIEADLGIKWTVDNAVIRKEMRTPLYKKLKKAGCILIGYGMETPSHRLLEKIGKNFSKGVDMVKVLKEGKKSGIYISVNIMFGIPGETEQEHQGMLKFVVKNRRNLNMLNPSLTFCEFYPGSLGHDYPEKYGIDMNKGSLFWEMKDGTNNYLTRMRRFEDFCKVAKKYKFETLFDVYELPNKQALLFEYFLLAGDKDKALEHYKKIPDWQITSKYKHMYDNMIGIDNKEKEPSIPNYLLQAKSSGFDDTYMRTSFSRIIDEFEKLDIFSVLPKKRWKRIIRNLTLKIIGYEKIESRIGSICALIKLLDERIMYKSKVYKK